MKRKFVVDTEKVEKSISYRMSTMMMKIPTWISFIMAIAFSVLSGYVTTQSSIMFKEFVNNDTPSSELFEKYVLICSLSVLAQMCIILCTKTYSLNRVNNIFLREYEKVFNSRTADISRIGPAKIQSAVNSLACLKAERGRIIVRMITCGMPFLFTIVNIGMQNVYAAIGMVVTMTIALTCSVNGDKWFHFDTVKSSMKGDLQQVSINSFIVIRMLKYMNAMRYAYKRLDDAQEKASPAMYAINRLMYNSGLLNALYQLPILMALYVAIKSGNTGLIIFVAMNDWAIMNMIDCAGMLAENISEANGEQSILDGLTGDDIPMEEKPPMPESMTLTDVEFYYPTDKEH